MKQTILALAFVMAGGAFAAQAAEKGNAERGHAFAEANCARCHAVALDGASPLAEAPPFRIVATRWPPENLAEALAEGIRVGHTPMPEFVLDPDQIDDFIAYLEVLTNE
ncbi:MAG: cytochrome c [Proteobacteria bacterium]|nr:cytochrome c [Pseudomonadota bacterium]